MKPVLLVLWHAGCVFAGYWVVFNMVHSEERHAMQASDKVKAHKTLSLPSMLAHTATPTLTALESRLAALTPATWANELDAIAALPLVEMSTALRGLLRARYPEVRRRLIRALFERWAVLDRKAALTALGDITSPQMKAIALRAVLQEWVKTGQDAAWQWVAALEHDSVLQESGVIELLQLTAGQAPERYRAWALELEEPFLRTKVLWQLAQAWVRQDPAGALEAACQETDSYLRRELFERVMGQGEDLDPTMVLERIMTLPAKAERLWLLDQGLVRNHITKSPDAAFRWLVARSHHSELQGAAGMIGSVLAARTNSLDQLLAHGNQLPPGPLRDVFFASAANAWSSMGRASEGIAQLLNQCGPCLEREEVISWMQKNDAKR